MLSCSFQFKAPPARLHPMISLPDRPVPGSQQRLPPWHPFLSSVTSQPNFIRHLGPCAPQSRARGMHHVVPADHGVSLCRQRARAPLHRRHSLARYRTHLPHCTTGRSHDRSPPTAVLPKRGLRCPITITSSRPSVRSTVAATMPAPCARFCLSLRMRTSFGSCAISPSRSPVHNRSEQLAVIMRQQAVFLRTLSFCAAQHPGHPFNRWGISPAGAPLQAARHPVPGRGQAS
ncbi:hypothetical protein N657DRAFT_311045 [Parathielavia appendiculata]|uniref:Uncharacterized protein n=1 Tax=Parathielavia appendiculata TaxID=2587402 RepID=A0AAN6U5I5_9PEZI|nr:hypothetical protein N657DRAFT_311045 [Parathielavia appendiculata]